MRILIYSLNYEPELTGIGKFNAELARWLTSRGHDVNVITSPPHYPNWKIKKNYSALLYKKEIVGGVKVTRCPLYIPKIPSGFRRILHQLTFMLSSFPVVMIQYSWKPDIIIQTEPPLLCSLNSFFLAYLTKAQTLLHIQDFELDAAFNLNLLKSNNLRFFLEYIEKKILFQFNVISTISPNMIIKLLNKKINRNKILLFPNWVNTEKIYPLKSNNNIRKKLNIGQKSIVVLYSGSLGEKQGIEVIFDIIKELRCPSIVFVVCGAGAFLEDFKKRISMSPSVKWLPLQSQEKLNELLNLADIHFLPQKREASDIVMPSKLTGMLASGIPVIATALQNSQIDKVLFNKGIVVPPGDIKAISAAIKKLAFNEKLRSYYGKNARKYAEKSLSMMYILSKFEKDLIKLLK